MRRLALAASLVLASTPCFAAGTYDDLRSEYPVVAATISRLPSSGINGTLHHISALLAQPRAADAAPGSWDTLPLSYQRQMQSAIDRLGDDVQRGLPFLAVEDQLVLAQVVNEVAVERNVELHQGLIVIPCAPGEVCLPPDSVRELEPIVSGLAASIRQGLVDASARTGLDLSAAEADAAASVTPDTFGTWLDAVVESCGVLGVEHIDS